MKVGYPNWAAFLSSAIGTTPKLTIGMAGRTVEIDTAESVESSYRVTRPDTVGCVMSQVVFVVAGNELQARSGYRRGHQVGGSDRPRTDTPANTPAGKPLGESVPHSGNLSPQTRKRSVNDSLPCRAHQLKEIGQVVDAQESPGRLFTHHDQVPQIRTREPRTRHA
jgi:hypothetical protein